jgi:dsDNA-specific endonuclease/ATPase MutS2
MTPDQRLDRVERILGLFVRSGRQVRGEWRQQAREQNEKINILIQTQMETEEIMKRSRTETEEILKRLALSQADLTESQKRTDKALRAFINSNRKSENGNS